MAAQPGSFRPDHRLRKPSEFQKVFDCGQRSADSQFLVLAARNGLDLARLGLVITKRRHPSAVVRNRLKRVARESFRRHKDLLQGLDIVVLSQKATATGDSAKLRQSLSRHWERIAQCGESSST